MDFVRLVESNALACGCGRRENVKRLEFHQNKPYGQFIYLCEPCRRVTMGVLMGERPPSPRSNLKLIVAMDENNLIGNNNDLPWHLPSDLEFVRLMTTHYTIIMGRKNYESIGRPLPHRRNIILTRDYDYSAEGCEVHLSPQSILESVGGDLSFVFGGREIYKLFLPYVSTMYVTRIHAKFEGDTYFPEIDWNEWEEISVRRGVRTVKDAYDFTNYVYMRKMEE